MAIDWMMQSSGKDAGSTRAPLVSYSFVRRTTHHPNRPSFFLLLRVSRKEFRRRPMAAAAKELCVCEKEEEEYIFRLVYSSLWPFLRAVQYPI
jgi:hypothetical protein